MLEEQPIASEKKPFVVKKKAKPPPKTESKIEQEIDAQEEAIEESKLERQADEESIDIGPDTLLLHKSTQTATHSRDELQNSSDRSLEERAKAAYEQRIASLTKEVELLRHRDRLWKDRLRDARARKEAQKSRIKDNVRRRPFVSTLGDYWHHDFNATLLGLQDEIYHN